MDVHHHPHVGKKKFTEYLLEGLMIFIAVSLGFIAENLRESISDNRKIHEYMESIVNDLQSDLAMYKSSIAYNERHCRMIDTIFTAVSNNKMNVPEVYYMARALTMGSSVISPNTKTFEQMKSSGGLRLIPEQYLADSIASYYQWTSKFDYWSNLQRQRINDLILDNEKVFDASGFLTMLKTIQSNPNAPVPQIKIPDMHPSSHEINQVLMHYQYYYGMLVLMNQRCALAAEQAKRLIDILKK
jgi:hypothetical protein